MMKQERGGGNDWGTSSKCRNGDVLVLPALKWNPSEQRGKENPTENQRKIIEREIEKGKNGNKKIEMAYPGQF